MLLEAQDVFSVTYHHDFLGGLLLPHQHRSEVHSSLHCDVELEGKLDLSMLVPDYHLVVPLVVRLGLVAPKGNCIFFPISPKLVSEIKWICLKAQGSLCFTLTQLTNL